MSSSWIEEVKAVLRKETLTELRAPNALATSILFGIVAVIALSVAAYNIALPPTLAAGLFWVVVAFASVSSLPRLFLEEEERGTGDILRLTARPHAVFWGKALFNLLQCWALAVGLAALFIIFNSLTVRFWGIACLSVVGGCLAMNGGVTLCGAVAARANNRYALAAAIGLPIVVPVAVWGVSSLRVAFGDGPPSGGLLAGLGLCAYGVACAAVGPYIYASLWKR